MAADTARLTTNVTLDPDGCVLSSEGYEFTVDGNPNFNFTLTLGIVASTFEFFVEGSATGGLDWTLDDRSGTCMIDLTFGLDQSGPEPAAIASGTMCGLEVEFVQRVVPPWGNVKCGYHYVMHTLHYDRVIACEDRAPPGEEIGRSRRGRPIFAYRIGGGPLRVSLIGGCHADEPVGPRFLGRLVRFLAGPSGAELRRAATWSVIPHVNPDGAGCNAAWQTPRAERYDFVSYLRHRVRELPGDDIEFGFPRGEDDAGARPENRAAWEFWQGGGPYHLHVSMHGMSVAGGPYFLVERSWWPRFREMAGALSREVEGAGYALHDVQRLGEKGFHRLGRGFCSRPDSRAMRRHFLDLEDPETAARFRPSSMEAVRSLGGDPLTLVTEMPLFITPGVGAELGPRILC